MRQSLPVGIGNKKVNALKVGIDHIVDGVTAGATNTNNGDTWTQLLHILRYSKVNGHD